MKIIRRVEKWIFIIGVSLMLTGIMVNAMHLAAYGQLNPALSKFWTDQLDTGSTQQFLFVLKVFLPLLLLALSWKLFRDWRRRKE